MAIEAVVVPNLPACKVPWILRVVKVSCGDWGEHFWKDWAELMRLDWAKLIRLDWDENFAQEG